MGGGAHYEIVQKRTLPVQQIRTLPRQVYAVNPSASFRRQFREASAVRTFTWLLEGQTTKLTLDTVFLLNLRDMLFRIQRNMSAQFAKVIAQRDRLMCPKEHRTRIVWVDGAGHYENTHPNLQTRKGHPATEPQESAARCLALSTLPRPAPAQLLATGGGRSGQKRTPSRLELGAVAASLAKLRNRRCAVGFVASV